MGVQRIYTKFISVSKPLMPQGVEHRTKPRSRSDVPNVSKPLMPQGVEHDGLVMAGVIKNECLNL